MANHTKRGFDPAADFLADNGETFEAGNKLKYNATELADYTPTLGKKNQSKKGGVNLRKVAEVLEDYGLDPTEEILRVIPELDESLKAKVMLELLQYVQPKLKAVEVTGKDGGPLDANVSLNIGFKGVGK